MRAHRLASVLLLGLSLAACASNGPGATGTGPGETPPGTSTTTSAPSSAPTAPAPPATTTATNDHITGPYVLTMKQKGGIAAFHMEIVMDSAAKKMSYGGPRNQTPQTHELTDDEVASLTRLLDDAGWSSFAGFIKGAAPADAFTYEIVLSAGGNTRSITWSDGATPPAPILQLRTYITKLREEKFRGAPAKNAPVQ